VAGQWFLRCNNSLFVSEPVPSTPISMGDARNHAWYFFARRHLKDTKTPMLLYNS